MSNIAVVGMQWGDEGKGKIIDILSKDVDVIVRFQGGNNAGHTVIDGPNHYAFHLIPSGILREGKVCVLGNGMVIDPLALFSEIDDLRSKGVEITPGRLMISENAHIIFPYHRKLDGFRETLRSHRIGTTGRGIGPCYMDKIARCGIRAIDLIDEEVLYNKLKDNMIEKNKIYMDVFGYEGFEFDEIFKTYKEYGGKMSSFITNTFDYLHQAADEGKRILFEGAQGTMLDVDFGTYPYVTSSNTTVGGIITGTGLNHKHIGRIIGICKAYTTRVGEGPFPTELKESAGELLRTKGHEFGTTTGRPRRCGWFDAVVAKYSAMINGIDEMIVTKLDVLDGLDEIEICVKYKIGNSITDKVPNSPSNMERAEPVYLKMKGWKKDTSKARDISELPREAREYLDKLAEIVGVRIGMVSVGSDREAVIRL